MDNITMKLLTMCFSMFPIAKEKSVLLVVLKNCGEDGCAIYKVDISEEGSRKKSICFYILPFICSRSVVPNRSKLQKGGLKKKAVPTTNVYLWYHFFVAFPTQRCSFGLMNKYIGHKIKVWEVVQYRLSFPFPPMVLTSSKLQVWACQPLITMTVP